ncbi:MAG: D-serine/D-alanine/glycine transporter, partial [Mycetocola sp.]
SYLSFRKRRAELHERSAYRMPGGIPMVWAVFAFFAFVLWALTTQPDTFLALLVTPVWFVLLGIGWLVLRRRPSHLARYASFQRDLQTEKDSA